MPKIPTYPAATNLTGATLVGVQGGAVKRFPATLLSTGAGATNLDLIVDADSAMILNDNGDGVELLLADGTNAGLLSPTEKTKLADIETGATADQTAAEILTAIKTVDGAGSGLDADKLDGHEAAYFAPASDVEESLKYRGPLDCSANPNYPASQLGDVYVVTVAGKIGGSFGKAVRPRDVLISLGVNSAGTEASVGAGWNISQGLIFGMTPAGLNMLTAANEAAQKTLLDIGIGDVSGLQDQIDTIEARITTLEDSPSGGSISNPGVAYIRSDGDDSTGDGSINAPWATLQLAYIGGYKVMDIGVGTFAGITGTTLNLHLHGKGVGKTIVGNITGTSGDVTGNGRTMITVGDITIQPLNADPGTNGMSEGDPGSNGNPGTAASAVTVRGLTASTIALIGGSAGAGGHGANNSSSGGFGGGGGTGGDGGAGNTLTIVGCETSGIVMSRGGSPGNGGAAGSSTSGGPGYGGSSGSGGNGGAPGALVIRDSIIGGYAHTPPISGGSPGSPGTGNDGNGSTGSNGSDASGGTVLLTLSSVASVGGFGETITPQGAVIAGAFYANTYP